MMARRLQLWRQANFDIAGVSTTGDVNLFDCVSRENPSDERLIAVAEGRGHTLLELAFSWLLTRPTVASVIAGATSAEQVRANAAAAGWRMSEADLAAVGQ